MIDRPSGGLPRMVKAINLDTKYIALGKLKKRDTFWLRNSAYMITGYKKGRVPVVNLYTGDLTSFHPSIEVHQINVAMNVLD